MTGQATRESSIVAMDREERLVELDREIYARVESAKEAALVDPSIIAETHDIVNAIQNWAGAVRVRP